jgi:response regulator RpfG family c-di-GMP phosphodiesterase
MEQRRRTLVAAQPGAWSVLQRVLDELVEPVPVHSIDDGFRVLDHDSPVDLIIATIAFDDSRMVEFLQAVKRNPPTRAIPFLCSRVLANVLPDSLVGEMRNLCKQCGAVDLLDLSKLDSEAARGALRAAIQASLQ